LTLDSSNSSHRTDFVSTIDRGSSFVSTIDRGSSQRWQPLANVFHRMIGIELPRWKDQIWVQKPTRSGESVVESQRINGKGDSRGSGTSGGVWISALLSLEFLKPPRTIHWSLLPGPTHSKWPIVPPATVIRLNLSTLSEGRRGVYIANWTTKLLAQYGEALLGGA